MELLIIVTVTVTVLSIFLSDLVPPCASQQIDYLQPQGEENGQQLVSFTTPPRKLKLTQQVRAYEGSDFTLNKKQQKENFQFSGKQEQQKQSGVVGAGKGEWVETGDDDPSQYFAMDYGRARRGRPPIHNKHLPVAP